jgi:hypothetical protein
MNESMTLIFDINKITDFVFGNPNDRTNEVEITESFVFDKKLDKMIPNAKEVKEVKVNDYTGQNTIRYDMVKTFIDILDAVEDTNAMTLGQKITYNTMQAYELIKDIKNNDNE